jgi:hypothetical protein
LSRRVGKPEGMHWQAFERLQLEYDALASRSLGATAQRFRMSLG